MDFAKDLFLRSLYNKIIDLVICFCKFNFSPVDFYNSLCVILADLISIFVRTKPLPKPDNEMYLIYDGDYDLFESLVISKKTRKLQNEDFIMCWDYKNDTKFETGLNMVDLIKFYSKSYKVKETTKSSLFPKSNGVYVVLTDISKSTELWNKDRFKMAKSIVEHDRIFYNLIKQNNGVELRNEGDSFLVAFYNKNECINFANEFYKSVSNISYDEHNKIGVKVAVNYEVLASKSINDEVYSTAMENTYKMINHSSTGRICISDKIVSANKTKKYCVH